MSKGGSWLTIEYRQQLLAHGEHLIGLEAVGPCNLSVEELEYLSIIT